MAHVQSNVTNSAAAASAAVVLNGVISGNLIVVPLVTSISTTTVSSVTDSAGNTYTRRSGRTFLAGAGGAEIWEAHNVIGGNLTITATFNQSCACSLFAGEYSNMHTSSPFDVQATTSGTSTTPSSGAATTNQNDELIVGVCGHAQTFTVGSGFTLRQSGTATVAKFEDKTVAVAGSNVADGTLNTSGVWTMCMATFKQRNVAQSRAVLQAVNRASTF